MDGICDTHLAGIADGHLQECCIAHGTHLRKKIRAACNIGLVPCQANLSAAGFVHAVYNRAGLPYSVQ
jgi:hypothetical protein